MKGNILTFWSSDRYMFLNDFVVSSSSYFTSSLLSPTLQSPDLELKSYEHNQKLSFNLVDLKKYASRDNVC
jgi:hypothetical protein